MNVPMETLLDKAMEVVPGAEYNRALERLSTGPMAGRAFYEAVLPEGQGWPYLRDRVYPGLARWLKGKRLNPETGRGAAVSLFVGDRCYVFRAEDFLDAFREIEGLSPTGFHFRVLQWL